MNFALVNTAYASVDSFLTKVNNEIINPLIIFLFGLALVYFLFGLFQFIMGAASEEKKTTGKSHMLWGIVGITIMMGVWTILNIILRTMNISPSEIDPKSGTVNLPDYNPPD